MIPIVPAPNVQMQDQDPQDPDAQRLKVLQALMKQQQPGAVGALAQLAQAAAMHQVQQRANETRANRQFGVNPVSPAFDDQGNAMPRAPGMAQPSAMQAIQNFFARGTE